MSTSTPPFKPLRAVILSFDQIDLIDFTSPYETIYQARDPATGNRLFRIQIAGPGISLQDENATMSTPQGLTFRQHIGYGQVLAELSEVDLLVVPGANWLTTERLSQWDEFPVRKIIKEFAALPSRADADGRPPRVLLSICSGSFFLAVAGVLANRRVTTHHLIIKELEELCAKLYGAGATEVVRKRFVDVGTLDNGVRVVASGGLTSAFDASLYAIELITNIHEAERVSEVLDYQWIKSEGLV
jgi:transcriptional regulator GlxA family with amidase domain